MFCTCCGEIVTQEDTEDGYTLCCGTSWSEHEPNNGLDFYLKALKSHKMNFQMIREHVTSFPADSKKRRKLYNKPVGKAAWPGKLSHRGLEYKKPKGSRKQAGGVKPESNSFDITIDGQHKVSIVAPNLKIPDIVVGTDRKDARRLARKHLRDMGMSITTADEIIEEPNQTIIVYR